MRPRGRVFTPSPVETNHPLALGLGAVWIPIPALAGGPTLFELLHPQTNSGALQSADATLPSWDGCAVTGMGLVRLTASHTQRVSVGQLTTTGAYTVAALFRPRTVSGIQSLVIGDDALSARLFQFRTNAAKLEAIGFSSGGTAYTITGGTTLAANGWYVGGFSNDGAAETLYLNGASDATAVAVTASTTAAANVGIGARINNGTWSAPGNFDVAAVLWWPGRALGAAGHGWLYEELMAGLPGLIRRAPRRAWLLAPAGGDVTVSLTGSAATFAAGTLTPATDIALSGQPATFSAGTLAPGLAVTLSGIPATFSAGTLSPAVAVNLSGVTVVVSAGTITPAGDVTVALTGQAVTVSAGNLTPGIAVTLSGAAATFATGTLSPALSVTLLGGSATFAAGTLTPSGGVHFVGPACGTITVLTRVDGGITILTRVAGTVTMEEC